MNKNTNAVQVTFSKAGKFEILGVVPVTVDCLGMFIKRANFATVCWLAPSVSLADALRFGDLVAQSPDNIGTIAEFTIISG